jgi:hypothetical protein
VAEAAENKSSATLFAAVVENNSCSCHHFIKAKYFARRIAAPR